IGGAPEGVRRDQVGAGLQVGGVDPADDVRARQVQVLVAALVVRAAEVGGREARRLEHRAHRPVEDEDAAGERVAKCRHSVIVAHMTMPALSLDGVRVVDLSRVLAGPFCGALLGDMGADVVKVEDPRAGGAAYEALMQAFSGIMSITGEPGGAPVRCGVSFLDLTTGILCAFGIVNALLYRDKSGVGQRVDGSLLETAIGLLNFQAEGYLLAGTVPRALGSAHPSLSPYRNFCCRDGQWVFIAGANDRLWRRLVTALGLAPMA